MIGTVNQIAPSGFIFFQLLNDRFQSGPAIRRRCFLRSSLETEKCGTNRHRYLTLLSDRVSIHQ